MVEVAETSLPYDRTAKAELYAGAALPEYWIIDLVGHCVEVHRNPSGAGYLDITRHAAGDTLSPLAARDANNPIADLLP